MAEVIRMPLLSDTMKEGKIIAWLKNVGDTVDSDDVLAEVETDKAVMEVVGYVDGTLLYQGVPAGESAAVNQIIAIVGEKGEDISGLISDDTSTTDTPSEPEISASTDKSQSTEDTPSASAGQSNIPVITDVEPILMPLLSDTMKEGKIISWLKNVGDSVSSDDVLAEVETDKATMEVVGYADGFLLYQGVEAGGSVPVNGLIAIVGPQGTDVTTLIDYYKNRPNLPDHGNEALVDQNATAAQAIPIGENQRINEEEATTVVSDHTSSDDSRVKASPLARKVAKEKGIKISDVKGTGPNGRVVKSDVDNHKAAPSSTTSTASIIQKAGPDTEFTDVPLSQMRKIIAERLGESKFSAPHFYLTRSIAMDNLLAERKNLNTISPQRISVNDLIVRLVAGALQKHPEVNSSWMGDKIRINHHINIGIAVAVTDGLIVPVIKDANLKSLTQIAQESDELIQKAKDKKLQPNEFTGNTFTISNLGMMGIEEFTAIINPPDACILAVGATQTVPDFNENGDLVKRQKMKVTLSCDHRVVDGAVGASFLQTLAEMIENPLAVLL